jgi:adenylylsulfate kinase
MFFALDNIHPIFDKILNRSAKEKLLNQKSLVIWMTGLSGSGKSTLARALENKLYESGFLTKLLDGDNLRTGLNNNLGFAEEDRAENLRRAAEVSKLFLNCGIITICSFISPTFSSRSQAKDIIGENDFAEVFIECPLDVCEQRDVKGLYAKARKGELKNCTGIDAPFEEPKDPSLKVSTHLNSLEVCLDQLYNYVLQRVKI